MIFKITREQIRTFFITSSLLLATWILMGHYAGFEVAEDSTEGLVMVNVSFLAPMNHDQAVKRLIVTCSDVPGRTVSYRTRWLSRNKVQVVIEEPGYPRGLEYRIEFRKAPALIPPFTVTAGKKVRLPLAPRLIALEPADNVPTSGPVTLIFNTPVDPESFRKHVTTTAPGSFSPGPPGPGKPGPGCDYSRWVLQPEKKLDNNSRHMISITGGLRGTGGGTAPKNQELFFTTAPALEITEIYPRPYDPSVWISRHITVRTNQELKDAAIKVEGMAGEVQLNGNTASFKPEELFMPARKYRVSMTLTSLYGEKISRDFWFGTTNLGSQRWISVKVGNPCTVRVFEGNRPLASCQGWLTIVQEKVPRVTMYEVKRGSSAEFNPHDPSPVRYIGLNADIMIHHLRPGESHNHVTAGLPPSYGCILLNKPDLDWIFDNVPAKCMVVAH